MARSKNRLKILRSPGLIFCWWLSIVSLVIVFSTYFPFTPTFPYALEWLSNYGPRWLTTFAHFDGVHYLTIITQGYEGTGLIQAFFPLFPLLVRVIGAHPIIVGMGISFLSLLISSALIDRLERENGLKILLLLLLFPTAFFFTALYTESLFLMLSLGSYYFAQKRKWWLASGLGFLAGLTRLPGFLLSVLLLARARRQNERLSNYIMAGAPLLGLLAYMIYLWATFGDPLYFVSVQSEFGAQRSTGTLIPLLTPVVRYARMIVSVNVWSHAYFILMQELLITLGAAYLVWRLFKRKAYALAVYSGLLLLLPTLTGTLSSMPRYALVIFPLFFELARTINGKWLYLVLTIFAILQLINLMLFTQGRWVS